MTTPTSEDWDETSLRAAIGDARRVVVKIGSSSLTTLGGGIEPARLEALVDVLADAHDAGRDVILITSGAIAAGLSPLGLSRRPRDLAHQQAAAAVGQGLLMRTYAERFATRDILTGQVLITVDDLTRQASYRNVQRTLGTMIRMGVVPIINENDTVATHEITFGDNDRLAALIAQLARADALILLSDVTALYTAHPDDPDAERIDFVPDVEALEVDTHRTGSAIGSGGMTTKVQAAQIAASAGIPVLLGSARSAGAALAGQPGVGTVFAPIDKRRPRRLLWLAFASNVRGSLTVDAGAARALQERHASLLAAGITGIDGDFVAGDPVEVLGPDGDVIGRGLVNFDAEDLPGMLGKKSSDLARELGVEYEREVIHRDALMTHPDNANAETDND